MIRFVATRLAHALVVVLAVATFTWFLLRAAPGDPFTRMLESGRLSVEAAEQLRRNAGLDRPLLEQYLAYMAELPRGELGFSFSQNRPVWAALREAIPNTLILALAALIIDFTVGITLGIAQAKRAGRRADRWLSVATLSLYSTPVFWLGTLLSVAFGQQLGWFPSMGMRDTGVTHGVLAGTIDMLHHLVLPAATLGLIGAAVTARYQRAALIEVVQQDFIRAARARGLSERSVWYGHALRNALLPAITLFGLSLPILLSGAVLTEQIFAWPGMGRLVYAGYFQRDYPLVTACVMLAAVLVVVGSTVADLLYRIADPRTRVAP